MSNIRKMDRGKSSTTLLKLSRKKHRSGQLYSNEKWLTTNPDGRLSTNRNIEGHEEEERQGH